MIQTEFSKRAAELRQIFQLQKDYQFEMARTTARQRIALLKKFHGAVLQHREEIKEALYRDFRKSPMEVDVSEIYAVTGEIKFAVRHLRRWMSPKRVPASPLPLLGSTSHIHYEPKGVVLIISPWNFPVNLTFCPLVSALAAGNCVMIKPSEHTPHTSAVMKKIIDATFHQREVVVVEGAVETARELLRLPFNHIFFTGSPDIGKLVMKAAAEHLASVTLELGGKSPTIVDETADLDAASRRITWLKFFNNGQICIAPDYLLVHEKVKDQLLEKLHRQVKTNFGESTDQQEQSNSYCRMVNDRHFERVRSYIEETKTNGGKIVFGGQTNATSRFISPTVIELSALETPLMEEEIFGPVLPVLTFRDLGEAIDLINSKEKPLTVYVYSKSRRNTHRIIQNTRAGATSVNHNGPYFFNPYLPFGGVNNSGIGKSHGWYGFEVFSNSRGVFRQVLPSILDLISPPYTKWKEKLMDLTIRWF